MLLCLTGHALFIVWLLKNLRELSLMSCKNIEQQSRMTTNLWYHMPVSGPCRLCQLLSRPSVSCQEVSIISVFSSCGGHNSPVKRRWHATGSSSFGLHCLGLFLCMGCDRVSSGQACKHHPCHQCART